MKTILALVLAAGALGTATAQTTVSTHVSIGINQPGVYGRIDIGDLPRPALYQPKPVVVTTTPYVVERRPIYLYVPPAHQQNWRRYCGRYDACGQPVFFVRDEWVRERYEHEHPGWNRRPPSRLGQARQPWRSRQPRQRPWPRQRQGTTEAQGKH